MWSVADGAAAAGNSPEASALARAQIRFEKPMLRSQAR